MSLPFKIALRFIRYNRSQSIFIILSIAIGISVQIFIGLLIQSLQASLVQTTIGNSSQITIVSKLQGTPISSWDGIIQKINSDPAYNKDIKYVSPSVDTPIFISEGSAINSLLLRGFDFKASDPIYHFKSHLIEGSLPTNDNEIMIGKQFAKDANLSVGKTVTVFTAKRQLKILKITGIFDFNVSSLNSSWAISNLQTAQNVGGFGNNVSSIEMQVVNVFDAKKISEEISQTLNDTSIKVENWEDQNADLLTGLQGQSISSIMIQVFVIVAVTLAIASVLAITVLQKSKEIGILKAMGLTDGKTGLVFLFQGLILGIIGAFAGAGLGLGLSFMFAKFAVNSNGTPVVPLEINYFFVLISMIIAVSASIAASIIPARNSISLDPIEVIRNG